MMRNLASKVHLSIVFCSHFNLGSIRYNFYSISNIFPITIENASLMRSNIQRKFTIAHSSKFCRSSCTNTFVIKIELYLIVVSIFYTVNNIVQFACYTDLIIYLTCGRKIYFIKIAIMFCRYQSVVGNNIIKENVS